MRAATLIALALAWGAAAVALRRRRERRDGIASVWADATRAEGGHPTAKAGA